MKLRSAALAAVSGLLLACSFPTLDFHFLAWFALVPFLISLKDRSPLDGFRLGAVAGIVYFTGTVYWVENSIHFYGNVPLIPASLIALLLCAYLALYPALFGALFARLRAVRPGWIIILAPAAWTALELARTYVFSGFPWSLLGYTQYRVLPVIQIADVTAVYGVSFLIVLVNVSLAELVLDRKRMLPLVTACAVTAVVLGYGFMKLQKTNTTQEVTLSVIQGNIEQDMKWDPAYQKHVIDVYKRLTVQAAGQHPELIIWPETATPFYFNGKSVTDSAFTAELKQFVRKNRVPLLFGSPTYEALPGNILHLRNSAFLLSADGEVAASYHKLHLVPFGEYVPFKSILFFVEKMVQAIGDFRTGTEYTVMNVPAGGRDARISTAICYEIIFPDLVRRFVGKGAAIMTTITNDAWFGRTAAPYQHFSMGVFRAIENRVPVARAANTGISGFIDAQGRILQASDIFVEATLTRTVSIGGEKSFYTRYGDIFSYICVFVTIVMLIYPVRKTKKVKSR